MDANPGTSCTGRRATRDPGSLARASFHLTRPFAVSGTSLRPSSTERLLALPVGFIHGELYPSNVLVGERTGRICAVDWEMAGIGPLLLDLAALTSGAWTQRAQRDSGRILA